MSVLIKGMEMPKNCMNCDFQDVYTNRDGDDEFTCELTWSFTLDYFDQRDGRLPTCPLIELPPHGRLIDADALIELCNIMAEKCDGIGESIWDQFRTTVEWIPTIIEAEE